MKKFLVSMGLLGIAALLVACGSGPSKSYTITGELVVVEPEPTETSETDATDSTNGEQNDDDADAANEEIADAEEVVDWSTAKVVVTTQVEGEDGESIETELATTNIVDGKFSISGEVEGPTEVKITAYAGEDQELTAIALLKPGGKEISVVLVDDRQAYPSDGLFVLGESDSSQDAAKKLTISGDFSKHDADLNMATIGVYGRQFKDGSMQSFSLGYVMLNDGKFMIEADVEGASVVNFYLSNQYSMEDYVFLSSKFVAEPKADYEVSLRGEDYLFVTSGKGKHAELIESWEQSTEFQEKFHAYETALAAYKAEQEAMREAAESTESISDEEVVPSDSEEAGGKDDDTDAEADTVLAAETAESSEEKADESQASTLASAEGCEHVVIDQTHQTMAAMILAAESSDDDPEHKVLRRELTQMKSTAMRKMLDESNDPFNVLLAMELGAIDTYGKDGQDALRVYDRLAEQLDPEIVAQRVTPTRDAIVVRIERNENDSTLLQGQKVPAFTLANAEGVDMAIYDILAEREVTLIDFWASWCGPCIATFPDLKRLYAAYKDDGFEIVGISIDDNFDDWNEASIEHEVPWIDLGELKDWEGPVAVSYGVGFIPKAYLVDSKGCVLKKHVHPEMLEEVLVQRFGEVPEMDESESDAGAEPVDPGADDVGG